MVKADFFCDKILFNNTKLQSILNNLKGHIVQAQSLGPQALFGIGALTDGMTL